MSPIKSVYTLPKLRKLAERAEPALTSRKAGRKEAVRYHKQLRAIPELETLATPPDKGLDPAQQAALVLAQIRTALAHHETRAAADWYFGKGAG